MRTGDIGRRRALAGTAAGFTLVEVVVALVIFEVGVLGVAGLLGLAHDRMNRAIRLEWAVAVAESVADSIGRFGYSAAGSVELSPGRVGWEPWSGAGGGVLVWVEDTGGARLIEVAVAARTTREPAYDR